jgi:hypothetical protein
MNGGFQQIQRRIRRRAVRNFLVDDGREICQVRDNV